MRYPLPSSWSERKIFLDFGQSGQKRRYHSGDKNFSLSRTKPEDYSCSLRLHLCSRFSRRNILDFILSKNRLSLLPLISPESKNFQDLCSYYRKNHHPVIHPSLAPNSSSKSSTTTPINGQDNVFLRKEAKPGIQKKSLFLSSLQFLSLKHRHRTPRRRMKLVSHFSSTEDQREE